MAVYVPFKYLRSVRVRVCVCDGRMCSRDKLVKHLWHVGFAIKNQEPSVQFVIVFVAISL